MGRVPNDFDVATDARPESVEALFPKAVTVGRDFGVTILPFEDTSRGGFHVEVATFREDGPYVDGRRPAHVTFSTPEQDAKRRDFTVNALFYDLEANKVIDYVGGEADIAARTLRAVGDPDRRFDEDKLRILRAVRFAAQLDFSIEPRTLEAVRRRAGQVRLVSAERVRAELVKLLRSTNAAKGLRLLVETGLWEVVLPELSGLPADHAAFAALERRSARGAETPELAALNLVFDFVIGDFEPRLGLAQALLKRLRFSNQELAAVVWVLRRKDLFRAPGEARRSGLARALAHPSSPVAEAFYSRDPAREAMAGQVIEDVKEGALQGTGRLPERLVNGEDLQKLGMPKGPELGTILEDAFDRQLEGELRTRAEALEWARSRIAKHAR